MKAKPKTSGAKAALPALPLCELSPEYWDLLNEFHEIDNHARVNGGPPALWDAIRAVGDTNVSIDRHPRESDLANVVRTFWGLPDAERIRIFNGWKPPAPEDRNTAGARVIAQTYGFHSFLTLTSHADRRAEPDAFFQEMPSEYRAAVRLHISVGTTYAEVKAAIEAFHETVSCDWDKLITAAPIPPRERKQSEAGPSLSSPRPAAQGITPAMIEHFYTQVEGLSERLGLPMAKSEDGLVMPDLTVRTLYQVDNDGGAVFFLLGPEFEPKKEAQDEE